MTENEMRLHRCCFTGHRPEKLTEPGLVIQEKLEQAILQAISDGFTTFISGTARGVDIWAAEIVLRLRTSGKPIKLICASPLFGSSVRLTTVPAFRFETNGWLTTLLV